MLTILHLEKISRLAKDQLVIKDFIKYMIINLFVAVLLVLSKWQHLPF